MELHTFINQFEKDQYIYYPFVCKHDIIIHYLSSLIVSKSFIIFFISHVCYTIPLFVHSERILGTGEAGRKREVHGRGMPYDGQRPLHAARLFTGMLQGKGKKKKRGYH